MSACACVRLGKWPSRRTAVSPRPGPPPAARPGATRHRRRPPTAAAGRHRHQHRDGGEMAGGWTKAEHAVGTWTRAAGPAGPRDRAPPTIVGFAALVKLGAAYSYRSASIGSRREARSAGQMPLSRPVTDEDAGRGQQDRRATAQVDVGLPRRVADQRADERQDPDRRRRSRTRGRCRPARRRT